MIILTKPYVSSTLTSTLSQYDCPVFLADQVHVDPAHTLNAVSEQSFFDHYMQTECTPLLCNSEASLAYIGKHLADTPLWENIQLFKNKAAFRQRMQKHYPQFYYRTISLSEWDNVDPEQLPYPIIVKPATGYSSIGVHRVENAKQWDKLNHSMEQSLASGSSMYSKDVINAKQLIIEQWIPGEEYAVDAYFDDEGVPVILNIFTRKFQHDGDTSDRIYYTSKQVISRMLEPITAFLTLIGSEMNLRNFPLHAEVRSTPSGDILPVEVNPLRFAGVGTTELGIHVYGINSYAYYFEKKKPNWSQKLAEMDDAVYSFFCAEYDLEEAQTLHGFDHERFKQQFSYILEYRIMPSSINTLAVVFYRSPSALENHRLCKLDLKPYFCRNNGDVVSSVPR